MGERVRERWERETRAKNKLTPKNSTVSWRDTVVPKGDLDHALGNRFLSPVSFSLLLLGLRLVFRRSPLAVARAVWPPFRPGVNPKQRALVLLVARGFKAAAIAAMVRVVESGGVFLMKTPKAPSSLPALRWLRLSTGQEKRQRKEEIRQGRKARSGRRPRSCRRCPGRPLARGGAAAVAAASGCCNCRLTPFDTHTHTRTHTHGLPCLVLSRSCKARRCA